MPGPLIQKPPLPDWLDPQNASVLDNPVISGLRKAAHWTGLDDPQGQLMQAAAGPAAPLVSIYSDPAERAAATEAFKNLYRGISENFGNAADAFAAKYPRVAAHISPFLDTPADAGGTGMAKTFLPYGKITSPIPVAITDLGKWAGDANEQTARGLVAHEGMHVAQALGNSDARKLYETMHGFVGYGANPFENTATSRETAAMEGLNKVTPSSFMDAPTLRKYHSFGEPPEMLDDPANWKSMTVPRYIKDFASDPGAHSIPESTMTPQDLTALGELRNIVKKRGW